MIEIPASGIDEIRGIESGPHQFDIRQYVLKVDGNYYCDMLQAIVLIHV